MEFEDVLFEVGDYGTYQKKLILYFLVPATTLLPFFFMNIIFMVSVPDHWCFVPELVSSNLTIDQQRLMITPHDATSGYMKKSCYRYDVNYTELLETGEYHVPNGTATQLCDQGYSYDTSYYDATAATKWNMVCSDDHYPSFVLTMYNVGSIIGTPIYGLLSDKIGRKPVFYITVLVTSVTAISSVLMTNFIAFVVLRVINGSLMPAIFQLPFILVLELVSPEMRTRMNAICNISWTVGLCFLPLVAYFSRNWVTLGLVTSLITVIYFFYWKFLPESPRWLLSQEKYEDALETMMKIAKKNGKKQDPDLLMMKLRKLGEKIKNEKAVEGVENKPADLLKYPQLRKKFIIITFCWIANITTYYGLQLNVPNLGGNEFLNFFWLALVEIPGMLASWIFMASIGRRWCTVTAFLISGFVCMLPAILPEDLPYVGVSCSLVGKFCSSATFMATYQQSSELYPTTVRSLGMGMSSTIASAATLAVPYLAYLSIYGKSIPFVIIGVTCIIAGVLAVFLPETLMENLPQTIADAEQFGLQQKFFSCNRKRRASCHENKEDTTTGKVAPTKTENTENNNMNGAINDIQGCTDLKMKNLHLMNVKGQVKDIKSNKPYSVQGIDNLVPVVDEESSRI